jgi:signal transduction histidine kinase
MVWAELLDAIGRQDTLGYLRARITDPMEPAAFCRLMGAERRAIMAGLSEENRPSVQTLENDFEEFYNAVTAEAFLWLANGRIWPWPRTQAHAVEAGRPLGLLRDSTHHILAELELKRLLPLLVIRAMELVGAGAAFLALADPAHAGLELVESRGLVAPVPRTLATHRGAIEVALAGQTAAFLDAGQAPWLAPVIQDGGAILVAPLWHHGELFGLIGCLGVDGADDTQARDLLSMLADLTAIAIRNAAYYREIHFKAADLQAANERLRDLDRMKDLFLATVSHELRTPLNFITGFGSILMDGEDVEPLLEEQRYFLSKVMGGAFQLIALVDDLLDYSRIRAGQLSLTLALVDASALLTETWTTLNPLAKSKGLTVRAELPSALPLVNADAARLAQVVRNLLSNALKFTPHGGTVVLRALVSETGLRIEVEDNGLGVAPVHQSLLFQRFSQLETPDAMRRHGTGLGLAISKSLIEAHGGTIGLRSPMHPERQFGDGAGSNFWFELPLALPL